MNEQKTISDLRAVLFDTIAGVRDGSIDLEKAKVISGLSQVMVNSAKTEVDYVKATNGIGSAFLDKSTITSRTDLPHGITGVTIHKLKG